MDRPSSAPERQKASFRDPSGFLFREGGFLYRQVNKIFAGNYDLLMNSGLYKELAGRGLLIPHKEADTRKGDARAYKVIRPEMVEFISYPYEWCFSELKDAALLTLKIQKIAMKFGMSLRDASAYNIQFHNGRPVLIDTLSFEKYEEGKPWAAYGQFCRHLLAPLALMSATDVRLSQLLRVYVDGIPLDLASKLLPWKSWLRPAIFFHIHMHAKSQKRFSEKKVEFSRRSVDRVALGGLLENLKNGISALRWGASGTTWADYYENTNYSSSATAEKMRVVGRFIEVARPSVVWDMGANEGLYSRLASKRKIQTITFDIDEASVERNYLAVKKDEDGRLLPLVADLTNPSPALGWANEERQSLIARGPADLALALALIHHLAISNNVPFPMVAEFFASICKNLVIEFIPKDDSQVRRLLKNRGDIFDLYTKEEFEKAFERHFRIVEMHRISGSARTMYFMKKK